MPRQAGGKPGWQRTSRVAQPRQAAQQQTLKANAVVCGVGYWSGKDVRVEFRPAPPDSGIVFVRDDLPNRVRIPARVEHRIETPLRTTLSCGGARVEMIEHVLASLAGLGIDNCEVGVDQVEMPGLDGSSGPFVEAICAAGIEAQDASAAQLIIREVTRLGDEESWIEARPSRSDSLSLRYRLDYRDTSAIGRQTVQFELSPELFRRELAPCRTFIRKSEAEWLRSQGFAQRVTTSDVLVFDDEGPIGNTLRFEDECARHKLLDMVGDLALCGCRVVGQIASHCGGHRLNSELVRILLQEGERVQSRRRSA
ncbi:MAG: UDP-3-O-acyl-N-acetylglucosamine deacetylase [Planctomycetia bacterium]|nr:UDP-3-O-acyl-N-acetylglucosamine deacetylase [Planctomycetia bacterium]